VGSSGGKDERGFGGCELVKGGTFSGLMKRVGKKMEKKITDHLGGF